MAAGYSLQSGRKLQCIELVLAGRAANLVLQTLQFGNDAITLGIIQFALLCRIVDIIIYCMSTKCQFVVSGCVTR